MDLKFCANDLKYLLEWIDFESFECSEK